MNYEASEVFEVGSAHELILGSKDVGIQDSVAGPGFRTLQDDIDETDE